MGIGLPETKLQIVETWENAKTVDTLEKMCKKECVLSCYCPESVLFLRREKYLLCRYQCVGSLRCLKYKVKCIFITDRNEVDGQQMSHK